VGLEGVIRAQADPTLIERLHMTEQDHDARHTDCAERLLACQQKLPTFDLEEAAAHIYDALFGPDSPGSVVKVRAYVLCTLSALLPQR
jgi:hypothetical protein